MVWSDPFNSVLKYPKIYMDKYLSDSHEMAPPCIIGCSDVL
jgi:hypothetical protein